MGDCCRKTSVEFFDALAGTWDSMHDLPLLAAQLDSGLSRFGIASDTHVLDVGCGTGNLTMALLRHLPPNALVTAVDISAVMIARARAKTEDQRVRWICGPVESLNPAGESFSTILCFSVWPHMNDPLFAAQLFRQMLKPGGKLHIWHLISRQTVNKIHSQASPAVSGHLLAPADETALMLEKTGFVVEEKRDDAAVYLVSARKD